MLVAAGLTHERCTRAASCDREERTLIGRITERHRDTAEALSAQQTGVPDDTQGIVRR